LIIQTLLKRENQEMRRILNDRKERKTGKYHIIKNKNIISIKEIHDEIKIVENIIMGKKKKDKKRKLSISEEAEI
jgi:hypothetical protein